MQYSGTDIMQITVIMLIYWDIQILYPNCEVSDERQDNSGYSSTFVLSSDDVDALEGETVQTLPTGIKKLSAPTKDS